MKKNRLPAILMTGLLFLAIGLTVIAQCEGVKDISNEDAHPSKFGDLLDVKGSGGQQKKYEGFRISFNPVNKTPDWVSWELLGTETDGVTKRSDKFWTDPEITGCPQTSDYRNSGYDRGHMCPSADQKWSEEAMNDCFSLANITPQAHSLNTGAWKTLETKERIWAKRDSAIVIVAGPIYGEGDNEKIGKAGVRVPGAFFKVMATPWGKNPKAIGFIYPNMNAPGNMQAYSMTVREVEEITGFDFFHSLPDELENKIETETSFREWDKH